MSKTVIAQQNKIVYYFNTIFLEQKSHLFKICSLFLLAYLSYNYLSVSVSIFNTDKLLYTHDLFSKHI